MDLHILVKRAAAEDLRACRLSRQQVADELSIRMRQQISLALLDAMIAETKSHRFPAAWLPAWIEVTGSVRILALLCGAAGYSLSTQTDLELSELGRTWLAQQKIVARLAEKL